MPKRNRQSTTELEFGRFKPHGSMDVQILERFNVLEATGPFNRELVVAADKAQEKLDGLLRQGGSWGTILIFKNSAMASLEAIEEIGNIVRARAARGIRPAAIALVFGAEVEGGALMQLHYQKAYESAGIHAQCFSDEAEAKSWLKGQIADTDSALAKTAK